MPRIRSIKPDFWNDSKLGNEPEGVMLTFIGLWNFSDDYGVVKSNALWLKNQIYPYKDSLRIQAFSTWLDRLVELKALIPFTFRGEGFFCIRAFRKHQKVEKPSKARNCPEDILIQEMENLGWQLTEFDGFIEYPNSNRKQSGNSRGIVGEYSPLDIGKEGDKEKDIGKGKDISPPNGDENAEAFSDREEYGKIEQNMKSIADFITAKKPVFIEPYKDLWNLFAEMRGFSRIEVINESRKRKFRIRCREKGFDFPAVLRKAFVAKDILTGGKWFSFDWILENETNYLKVIEGNYDKPKKSTETDQTKASEEELIEFRRQQEAETRRKLDL